MSRTEALRRLPWNIRYGRLERAASDVRRLQAQLTHLHATLVFEGPIRVGPGFALRIPDNGTLIFGPAVDLRRNFVCEIAGDGKVTIGHSCIFTGTMLIQCSTRIDIGPNVIMGQGSLIADGNHRFRDPDVPFLEQGYNFRPITIGEGVVAHTNVVIVNDIGERSVIGANSVVTRPIPPYCLAAGVPAKVVDYFGPPELAPPDLNLEPRRSPHSPS